MGRTSAFLANPPPEVPQDSEAYQTWLRQRSDAPNAQPRGNFDHDTFIAQQFMGGDGEISSKDPWVEAGKARRVKKNVKTARAKAAKNAAEEELEGLAAAHAALQRVMGDEKRKKVTEREKMANAAKLLEGTAARVKEQESAAAGDEDGQIEWEDVEMSGGVAKIDNEPDDLERQFFKEFDRLDPEEEATATKENDRRKAEWESGGFAPGVRKLDGYDKVLLGLYSCLDGPLRWVKHRTTRVF